MGVCRLLLSGEESKSRLLKVSLRAHWFRPEILFSPVLTRSRCTLFTTPIGERWWPEGQFFWGFFDWRRGPENMSKGEIDELSLVTKTKWQWGATLRVLFWVRIDFGTKSSLGHLCLSLWSVSLCYCSSKPVSLCLPGWLWLLMACPSVKV